MRFNTLDSWLNWQQGLNPKSIQMGLDRVRQVYQNLNLGQIAKTVITVAGTNGKGSTVAYYETWLKNRGYRVASYTSPHLMQYNERIKLNLEAVSDDSLCRAFAAIDDAREDILLTYFEFGTLAALYLSSQFEPDVTILEVGLGGRLDAVNIIDADLAHITPIGLDHQDWLGETLEAIGYEKAGILRAGSPAICNMRQVPDSVINQIQVLKSQCLFLDRDYHFDFIGDGQIKWSDSNHSVRLQPPLLGEHQALNISGVLAGLSLLGFLDPVKDEDISAAFTGVSCPGRMQNVETRLPINLWVDVGHNTDAALVIAGVIESLQITGKVYIVLGMLADKNPLEFVNALQAQVDEWWVLGLQGDRGLSADALVQSISNRVTVSKSFDTAENCLQQAVLSLSNQDILLVCGSFMTVQAILSEVRT